MIYTYVKVVFITYLISGKKKTIELTTMVS